MRLWKNKQRRLEKEQGRAMSMTGWDQLLKNEKQRTEPARSQQRHISSGIGHHFARMMKGHI